jgi:hypothetical protein
LLTRWSQKCSLCPANVARCADFPRFQRLYSCPAILKLTRVAETDLMTRAQRRGALLD